jgi:KaiC/GvpD/RAD55 family RecA-like ATPase
MKERERLMKFLKILMILMIVVFVAGCPSKKREEEPEKHPVTAEKIDEALELLKKESALFTMFELTFFSDFLLHTHLLEDTPLRLRMLNAKEDEAPFLEKTLEMFNAFATHSFRFTAHKPEECSLYALRAFIMAMTMAYGDGLLHTVEMLEKFQPDEWSTMMLIAYVYFQEIEDEKALKYIDSAIKTYCEEEGREEKCSENSDDNIFKAMKNFRERIDGALKSTRYARKKKPLSNFEDCYYIETSKENYESDEKVNWSGECKDGWAEGEGELVFPETGTRYKTTIRNGYLNGITEIIYPDGKKMILTFEDGFWRGSSKIIKDEQVIAEIEYYDEKGYRSGKGSFMLQKGDNNFKLEGVLKKGYLTRGGTATCFHGTDKETMSPYLFYRYIKEEDFISPPICSRTKAEQDKIEEVLSKVWKTESERIEKLLKEKKSLDGERCTPHNGFSILMEHFKKELKSVKDDIDPKKVEKEKCPDTNKFCREHNGLKWSDKSEEMYEWEDAVEYCKKMGGRLPTVSELRTLLKNCPDSETGGNCKVTDDCLSESKCWDKEKCGGCEFDEDSGKYSVFGDIGAFMTYSENIDNSNSSYAVSFISGAIRPGRKNLKGSVLCVK